MMRAKAAAAADRRANDAKKAREEKDRLSKLQKQLNADQNVSQQAQQQETHQQQQQNSAPDQQYAEARNTFNSYVKNNALAAGLSENEWMMIAFKHTDKSLAFAQQNSLLSTIHLLPQTGAGNTSAAAPTTVVAPPWQQDQALTALIRKRGDPDDSKWPAVLQPSVKQFRSSLQDCIRGNLAARAIVEGRTELEIVREAGYFDVQSYIFNQSSYLGEDGPFGVKIEELYEIVPDNVSQARATGFPKTRVEKQTEINNTKRSNEIRKRRTWASKSERLEDWELQARAGEITRPAAVGISDVCLLTRADVNGPRGLYSHRAV